MSWPSSFTQKPRRTSNYRLAFEKTGWSRAYLIIQVNGRRLEAMKRRRNGRPTYHVVEWKGSVKLVIPKACRQQIERDYKCLACGVTTARPPYSYQPRWLDGGCTDSVRWLEYSRKVRHSRKKISKRRHRMEVEMEHIWLLPSKAPDFVRESNHNDFLAWLSRFNRLFPTFKHRRWFKWRPFVPEMLHRALHSSIPELRLHGIELCFSIRKRCLNSTSDEDMQLQHLSINKLWQLRLANNFDECCFSKATEFLGTSIFCVSQEISEISASEILDYFIFQLENQLEDGSQRHAPPSHDTPSHVNGTRLRNKLMGTEKKVDSIFPILISMIRMIISSLDQDTYDEVMLRWSRLYEIISEMIAADFSDEIKMECIVLILVQSEWDDVYFPIDQDFRDQLSDSIRRFPSIRHLPSKKELLRYLISPSSHYLRWTKRNGRSDYRYPALPQASIASSLTQLSQSLSMAHFLPIDGPMRSETNPLRRMENQRFRQKIQTQRRHQDRHNKSQMDGSHLAHDGDVWQDLGQTKVMARPLHKKKRSRTSRCEKRSLWNLAMRHATDSTFPWHMDRIE
eukprot:TRINITY_DN4695_c0_g1_i1.p1 TRINITY_DN4695_c0_g1~~TRINITY_DN4695_c0_g1_i1.p1  ORF type:complete len:567 (-),score=101.86 TRINITY_DN4695_c0_g1_i1:21-1721(-)